MKAEAVEYLRFRFHRKRTASASSFHIPGAHYESVKALQLGIDGIVSALNELCHQNENFDAQSQAHDVLDAIQHVSFLSF